MNICELFENPWFHFSLSMLMIIPLWLYSHNMLAIYPSKTLTGYRMRYRMTMFRTIGMIIATIALAIPVFFYTVDIPNINYVTLTTAIPVIAGFFVMMFRMIELSSRITDRVSAVFNSFVVGFLLPYALLAVCGIILTIHPVT